MDFKLWEGHNIAIRSLTYGHAPNGFYDCDSVSGWSEVHDDFTTEMTVEHGDIFKITGTCAGAGNEYFQIKNESPSFSTNTYKNWLLRWKTSVLSNGLGARAKAILMPGDVDVWLLGETQPQFNGTWQVASGTLPADKTLEQIHLFADDYPDTVASGESSVYFDFILFHKGTWTFPYAHVSGPEIVNRYADIEIPGRVGDITQYLGMQSPSIKLSGKIDIGPDPTNWGVPPLDKLYQIMLEAHKDPWQWFSTGGPADADHPERFINCKVTPRNLKFTLDRESGSYRIWSLDLKLYSLSSGAEDTWQDKQWFGI